MDRLDYKIDSNIKSINILDENEFICGVNKVLSNESTDVTFGQEWYPIGYGIFQFLTKDEFTNLYEGISNTIKTIINTELGNDTSDFTLEKYHNYVHTNEEHLKVVSKTRDLFSEDFNFPIMEMIPKFEKFLNFKLTNINPKNKQNVHIIVRVNRPNSPDYNPPHKDMYEAYDGINNNGVSYFPQFVNFWIPIAGVTKKTSLPIAPKSHLVPENLISRTNDGATLEGGKYRVRLIKDWNGSNELIRTDVTYGEMLVFSSHLIHGLGMNEEDDLTRVALEFRLYKDE